MLRLLAALLVAALAVTGCAGEEEEEEAAPYPSPLIMETPAPGAEIRIHAAEVRVRVGGAVSVDHEDTVRLQVTEIMGDDLPRTTWFLQVGFAEPVFLDETTLLHVGFDLAPGLYEDGGSYELDATGASPIEGAEGITSGVVVRYTELAENRIGEFGRFVAPCSLEVEDRAVGGRILCPELADDAGETISLTMEWTLV